MPTTADPIHQAQFARRHHSLDAAYSACAGLSVLSDHVVGEAAMADLVARVEGIDRVWPLVRSERMLADCRPCGRSDSPAVDLQDCSERGARVVSGAGERTIGNAREGSPWFTQQGRCRPWNSMR